MSDPKRQAKRTTRAERRAAEEAAKQAEVAKAAKERKQQTTIGIIVVAIIIVLVAIAGFAVYKAMHPADSNNQSDTMTVSEAYSKLQSAPNKPANAGDKAGFLISDKGYAQKAADAPTVSIYMEPLCPGCASVNRELDPTLIKLMNAGQLNIELHLLNFQNSKSSDDYSNRAFNAAIYIAEHDSDPDHLLGYISNIYAEDFQPGELSNYVPVDNGKLKEQAVKAGVSEEVATAAFSGENEYVDWLTASNNYTILRPELFSESGGFSSPTLTINGEYWSLKQITLADTSMVDGFLKAIGLDSDQVGVKGKMPSIGENDKPISLTE